MTAPLESRTPGVRATVGVVITLAGAVCGLTLLYLGMRAVMDVGGTCAEGGPFEIRQQCPQGIPLAIMGGLWGGLILAGLYAAQVFAYRIPHLLGLAWPALFLSLGWNFFEFAFDPPLGEGVVWGWLVCGVVFALMGGLPLIWVLPSLVRNFRRGPAVDPTGPSIGLRSGLDMVRSFRRMQKSGGFDVSSFTQPSRRSATDESGDIVARLERLAELHRNGALSDDEYEAAKQSVLRPD